MSSRILTPPVYEPFPVVDAGAEPLGGRILVQIRLARAVTESGIILTQDGRRTEQDNTQVAIVRAMGPLAYRDRDTRESWPEGNWTNPGEYIRIPKYGGDRFTVRHGRDEDVEFAIIQDTDVIAKITTDPVKMKSFI